jgi:hypothetical protein
MPGGRACALAPPIGEFGYFRPGAGRLLPERGIHPQKACEIAYKQFRSAVPVYVYESGASKTQKRTYCIFHFYLSEEIGNKGKGTPCFLTIEG